MLPGLRNRSSPPVHQGTVGVAEEEQIQVFLLGGKPAAVRDA
jgi:UDP-N-acetyl-D-mannosaminuronic acid transferase (WecB/TagA/CpsF family)